MNIAKQSLASIVSSNHQTAAVLEKYQLDFCCRGKRTLEEACNERGLILQDIAGELESLQTNSFSKHQPFTEMTAGHIIHYILQHHHYYVKQALPVIYQHLYKVATKHGERFPWMVKVFNNFCSIQEELITHMQKEETILFPRIQELEAALERKSKGEYSESFIATPILVMEQEHEHAGNLMKEINELTNGYLPHPDACTTHRITLAELKEFEEDLHKHVHLENYVLFPLAQRMMNDLL